MYANPAVFALLLIVSVVFFVWSCYRRFSLISLGKPEDRFGNIGTRFRRMLLYAFAQKRVAAKPFGINHVVIFWAFLILLLANGEFLLHGIFPTVSLALLPNPLHHALLVAFDIVSILALGAIVFSFGRRLFFKPAYLDSAYVHGRGFEALLILTFIALLMLAYFGLHGAEIALGNEPAAAFMPVSSFVGQLLMTSPLSLQVAAVAHFSWWLHALVLLAFICFLPHSKHMHILSAIPNCFFSNLQKPNTQPREEFANENRFGVGTVQDFTWKDLLDSFSCTECGRCQDACPAAATGKSLNPRQILHAIKSNLLANGSNIIAGGKLLFPLIGEEAEETNAEESIWACTTCGACLAACPVLIEQMPKIIKMRRYLVEMESKFPEELLGLFENMEQRSNPWGIAPAERTKWCGSMDVRSFEKGKTEYLLFIGCAGAFDSRNKHVTVALATILDAAGVSWGILGKEEKCCGDSLRRLGNEYVFDKIAKENVKLFQEKGIKKIVTQCPHCFSTLKNDYRQYGLEVEVIHHSELVNELLQSGKLVLSEGERGRFGKVLFHDSCYLGRHNDVYDAPRKAIEAATGSLPLEFSRNRDQSFCCGAGGGRMWMEENSGTRINLNRVEEARKMDPETICVSCPYCMTMFEDGLKDRQEGSIKVKDLAEVIAEGLR